MDEEQVAVTEVYEKRAESLSINVSIFRDLTKCELANILEGTWDFVHYIGHCEESGLCCSDANLDVSEIEICNVKTFFLNACGSFPQGIELVEKGAIAGGVTFHKVLDDQATKVGAAFAEMVSHGLSIEESLQIARQCTILDKQYTVVGDGTFKISQGAHNFSSINKISTISENRFEFSNNLTSSHHQGAVFQIDVLNDKKHHLFGNEISNILSKDHLLDILKKANEPVIYDGKYYWSDDLFTKLSSE
jgi:hypothetical protein